MHASDYEYAESMILSKAFAEALRSVEASYLPHSMHAYFMGTILSNTKFNYIVDKTSTGRTFCSRKVQVSSDKSTVLVIHVSFSKKNTYRKSLEEYKKSQGSDPLPLPIKINSTYPAILSQSSVSKLSDNKLSSSDISFRLPYSCDLGALESSLNSLDGISYYTKLHNINYGQGNDLLRKNFTSLILVSKLSNIGPRISISANNLLEQKCERCISFSIYFHDSEFDTGCWLAINSSIPVSNNTTALCESKVFALDKSHIASVFTEFSKVDYTRKIPSRI